MSKTLPKQFKEVEKVVENRGDPMLKNFIEDRFGKKYGPTVANKLEFALN